MLLLSWQCGEWCVPFVFPSVQVFQKIIACPHKCDILPWIFRSGMDTFRGLKTTFIMLTLVLMLWAVCGEATKEPVETQYPPCYFNPLCTCSKAFPDLGKVMCRDVPLLRIPHHINISKVYMLHMENNGLRSLEPHFLRRTGLYSVEISRNSLTQVPPEAFSGLERSLWELNLRSNHLREVPSRSLRYLQKLRTLDLSDNEITFVSSEDWRGLEESLEALLLMENGIIALQPSCFAHLKNLQVLDLSGNALFEVDSNVFKDGPFQLTKLSLANNMLSKIPYQQLSQLKLLRHLDLSLNRISEMQDSLPNHEGTKGASLNLDTLRLDYNQIQFLPPGSFKYLATLNRTYLNGNPISRIQENAFRDSKIRELFLRDSALSEVVPGMFSGLENSLLVLDLSGNNLTSIPEDTFERFDHLQTLSLEENSLSDVHGTLLEHLQDTLHELDLRGSGNAAVDLRTLGKLRNLRLLSLSRISEPNLSPDDFTEFSTDFEELRITDGNVKALRNHAFRNVRRLKRLDLSENSISTVESSAFAEVGHFLQYLNLANGLSSTLTRIPSDVLKHLTAIQHLDLSNNELKRLDESSFHSMKHLKILQLQDNRIETVPKGTFQGDAHSELSIIYLSFNHLTVIPGNAFSDLDSLETIRLDDNRIERIERKAFTNLDALKYLNLRGNKIDFIAHEAFENLPELEDLDLAYNHLKDFSFSSLDQVGILSSLSLNLSHNAISQLIVNNSVSTVDQETMHVNVKIMDFSHNNVSHIGRSYFKHIESSVTHLYLSHNSLNNVTNEVLGNMVHLQWLDLSHNLLKEVDFDVLKSCKKLQAIKLSSNLLSDIPKDVFKDLDNLRVVELSSNSLKSVPDLLFKYKTVERLDLSGNQLIKVPVSSFKGDAAASLMELDLSNNLIMSLHSVDIFHRFSNLQWLDLSSNPLVRIENGVFSYIAHLHCLDLSHNTDVVLDAKGRTFFGLDDTLEDLLLRNLSLNQIPELHLPYLKTLDLSNNEITTIPAELSQNLPSLRRLELSGNQLTSVPLVINSLTQLQYLGLSNNEIDSITFHRGSRLKELDIRNLPITYLEAGVLDHLQYLQTLRMSLPWKMSDFNIPRLIQGNHAIEHVYVESFEDVSTFGSEMTGVFPGKLRHITLTGRGFKVIGNNLLEGVRNPVLNLVVFNTSIEEIPGRIFENARYVRNVTVDVRLNSLRTLGNPNSGRRPNMPKKAFLLNLNMAYNKWSCDCELGWVEGWERSRRQYMCEEHDVECYGVDDDLRIAVCEDKKSKSVLEALKTDIECGWNSSSSPDHSLILLITSLTLSLMKTTLHTRQ